MARENIYEPLVVFYEKVKQCPLRNRRFNYFELAYVISGSGYFVVNGNRVKLHAGNLFLITPNDCHEFDLEGACEFMVIRFGQDYIKKHQWENIDHMESILYYASDISGSILVNEEDKEMVSLLVESLKKAKQYVSLYNEDLIRSLVDALIVIASRNLTLLRPKGISANSDIRILKIIDYIQEHIYEPKELTIANIAEKFGLSPTYLGSYFRKQCNESLQHYISSYRVRLISQRLRFSDKRIHEIAEEFGFTDESHINKFFKRHKGVNLSAYRERVVKSKSNKMKIVC